MPRKKKENEEENKIKRSHLELYKIQQDFAEKSGKIKEVSKDDGEGAPLLIIFAYILCCLAFPLGLLLSYPFFVKGEVLTAIGIAFFTVTMILVAAHQILEYEEQKSRGFNNIQ